MCPEVDDCVFLGGGGRVEGVSGILHISPSHLRSSRSSLYSSSLGAL
jgi:hypothetical protein